MARGEDDDLVQRARRGEEHAWAELYAEHAGRLLSWVRHLPHADPAADAEDVAAETWLTAAGKIGEFHGDREDFGCWLFGIARNVARSRLRTACSRATCSLGPAGLDALLTARLGRGAAEVVEDLAGGVVGADHARSLIARLPAREAEVLTCLDVVGLDVETTCRTLGLKAGAVRVARMRGLRRLRVMLGVRIAVTTSPDGVTRAAAHGM